MKNKVYLLLSAVFIALLFGSIIPASAQDEATSYSPDDVYVAFNQSIIAADGRPLGRSEILDSIAQQIADELSTTGSYSSVPRVLADEYGYERWPDNGQRVINEAVNYIGADSPEDVALARQSDLIDILQNTFYREMGVGVSTYQAVEGGTIQNVYVVVMGARPNVLPVVINDGNSIATSRDVLLYIHNELSLAYETDAEIIQQAERIRIANDEDGLSNAQPIQWENNNFALPWELTPDYGEKTVWVEFEDEKGVRVRSSATVDYVDPNSLEDASEDTDDSVTLFLTYAGDTLTLQIESERTSVRLQEVYFSWQIESFDRAYELENPEDLQGIDLENFSTNDCIQIRWQGAQEVVSAPDCEVIYLEARRFSALEDVFWDSRFGSFDVYDGPRFLGTCSNNAGNCRVQFDD